uniref:Smr domain-containing protein n=1 Tax=Anopheles triannulatus TaxID=58253 RepID=A0A2M4ABL4_9DIPT
MCPDEVFAQLTEMFGDYIGQQRIVETIEKFDGNLEACIEALLKNDEEATRNDKPPPPSSAPVATDYRNGPDSSTGARRKTTTPAVAKNQQEENITASFASLLQKGSFPTQQAGSTGNLHAPSRLQGKHPPPNLPSNFSSIVEMVAQGQRVMVLMRGAPGSGKSHLSRLLIDRTSAGDYRNHIFSADDYFLVNGVYKFQPEALDSAHRFTHSSVLAKAREGWSPIVVDNTNIRLWEMYPYVQIAADHGYYLDILEPTTHWRNNSRSLAIRNTHGVPEPKIKQMLINFEKLTNVQELYRLCKLEHALYIPPKMRHYPILPSDLNVSKATQNETHQAPSKLTNQKPSVPRWEDDWSLMRDAKDAKEDEKSMNGLTSSIMEVDLAKIPLPKPPRAADPQTPRRHEPIVVQEGAVGGGAASNHTPNRGSSVEEENFSWDFTEDWRLTDNWKPYDKESTQFWGQPEQSSSATRDRGKESPPASTLLFGASQPMRPRQGESKSRPQAPNDGFLTKKHNTTPEKTVLNRHKRGCPNENASFSEICALYPKIPESYLWDLFEKCSGDGDWVANLLLEEQKLENFESVSQTDPSEGEDVAGALQQLECNCQEPSPPMKSEQQIDSSKQDTVDTVVDIETDRSSTPDTGRLLQQQQSPRTTVRRGQEGREAAKKELEARVVVGNEHYSEHIRKIRLGKGIVVEQNVESPTDEMEVDIGDKGADSEVVEMQLGVDLVLQLHSIFKDKHCPKSLVLDNLAADRTRVFMATEMAEQLYLLFLDSMYSFTQEEKLSNMRQDARMAQLMETKEKYPALFKPQDPTAIPSLRDIIEMEEALAAYQKETRETMQKVVPQDLAYQMSQQKLKEMFPQVDSNDLLQILAAHNNRFDETVQVVNASIPEPVRRQMQEKEQLLKERAESEKQKLIELFESPDLVSPVPSSSSLAGEEAINFHLITAEECRNLSQHHRDLRNECHEKARLAIQRGVPGLADYYSQIARLHRTKIDMYDSRASNCIMEVHKLKLNNANVLDLHYLHSQEAVRCLELFLADHANKLLMSQQRFRTLYIITGRGLHSADGKPIIKQRVQALLRTKNIRYTELNPGYLKIKLYNRDDLEQLMAME